jgi:hypothetical protein
VASLIVTDTGNNRIQKFNAATGAFVSKIGGTAAGSGNDQFSGPCYTTYMGDYLQVCDYGNSRVVKRNVSDLAYVSKVATALFDLCSDGTHFYGILYDSRVRLYTDAVVYDNVLSAAITTVSNVCVSGEYVYAARADGASFQGVYKLNRSDLTTAASFVTARSTDADKFHTPMGMCVVGEYLYVCETGANRVKRVHISDMTYHDNICATATSPRGIATDGTYIWLAEWGGNTITKWAIDGTYDSAIATIGTGNGQVSVPYGVLYIPDPPSTGPTQGQIRSWYNSKLLTMRRKGVISC